MLHIYVNSIYIAYRNKMFTSRYVDEKKFDRDSPHIMYKNLIQNDTKY